MIASENQEERFAALLGALFGFRDDPAARDTLRAVLAARIVASGCEDAEAYLSRLASPSHRGAEVRALAALVTVGESFFFRLPCQFAAFSELVVPARLRAHSAPRKLQVLSAGCSTGEEAYTLAMALRPALLEAPGREVAIIGIDVNPVALARARAARYGAWQLRETPLGVVGECFQRRGKEYQLDEPLRSMVTFEERNLVDDDPGFWAAGRFDVIFFRNVAIYFSLDVFHRLVERFHRALAPGGYLFLGIAETLRDLPIYFEARETHGAFYYQRRENPAQTALPLPAIAVLGHSFPLPPASDPPAAPVASAASAGRLVATAVMAPVIELFERELFAEARKAILAIPDAHHDGSLILLHAAVLIGTGDFATAHALAVRALAIDPLNAAAHLAAAVAREQGGDRSAAGRHRRAALFLDPLFALAHLQIGQVARRAGDFDGARRSLLRAMELIPGEDPFRILLFGGGFPRDALIEVCRGELAACAR